MVSVMALVAFRKDEMILSLMFLIVFCLFVLFFPCRLGRTECSILTLAASATLLKESICCWEVQIGRFLSSQGTGCAWALWGSRAAGCGPARSNQTPTMW